MMNVYLSNLKENGAKFSLWNTVTRKLKKEKLFFRKETKKIRHCSLFQKKQATLKDLIIIIFL